MDALVIGTERHKKGEWETARQVYEEILRQYPDNGDALHLLGLLHLQRGNMSASVPLLERAIAMEPATAVFRLSLGRAREAVGRFSDAAVLYEEAARLDSRCADAHNNLAALLMNSGRQQEANRSYERALAIDPGFAMAHSNLLLNLHYDPEMTPGKLFEAHRLWAARHATSQGNASPPQADPDPGRRLRVGYVSCDFRRHSVGYFVRPLLASHRREQVEVFCYSGVEREDDFTQECRMSTDHWRPITGWQPAELAAKIVEDRIDVLVDLSGHSAGNQLLAFARRPAPVQVTYLGYPDTTGMDAMDYRLTDGWADPQGMTERWHSERLERLEDGFLCYWADPEAQAAGVERRGAAVFCAYHNLAKINAPLIGLWSRILRAAPHSRLLLRSKLFADEAIQERVLDQFSGHGIERGRIEARVQITHHGEHLNTYGQADIALDAFPYHGTTTTCDALSMGVPVVTLAGSAHYSRVGVSLLSRCGLEDLIANNAEEYVSRAAALAGDVGSVRQQRISLRQRFESSGLGDANRFTKRLEQTYRRMWRRWCEQARGNSKAKQETNAC